VGAVVGAPAAAVGVAVDTHDGSLERMVGATVGSVEGVAVDGAPVVVGAAVGAVEGVADGAAVEGAHVCPTTVGAAVVVGVADGGAVVGAAVGIPESKALPGTPAMVNCVLRVLLRSAPTPAAKSLRPPTSDTIVSDADSDAVTW